MVSVMSGSPPVARRRRWTASPRTDLALALLLGVVVLQSASDEQGSKEPAWAVIGLIELTALPLALRRSRAAGGARGDAGRGDRRRPAVRRLPAAGPGDRPVHGRRALRAQGRRGGGGGDRARARRPGVAGGGDEPIFVVAMYAVFAAAWALGDNLRTRRAYLAELEARAERLEREQEETARRAVAEEQARIARELHDVISHNVSVMVVQAAAGGDVFDDPSRACARGARLDRVDRARGAGRAAPAARRRRPAADDDGGGCAPQPGLARLPELIEQVSRRRAAGRADRRRGAARPAAPGWTCPRTASCRRRSRTRSSTRRAANVQVTIALRRRSDSISRSSTTARAARSAAAGRGIIGMRERAGAVRRRAARPARAPSGGFGVRATIPLRGARVSIRVLLCDDQALVRSGFRMILETREDLEVVGEAEDGVQALELTWRQLPDVVLMDVRMPGSTGSRRPGGSLRPAPRRAS